MSALYILLAPLVFYVFRKRFLYLGIALKKDNREGVKGEMLFLGLTIMVTILIVFAIEYR